MRRVALYEACNHFGVPFKQGAPATEMRDSLKVNNISDAQLMAYTKHIVVNIEDERGNVHQEIYPQVEAHESARLKAEGHEINYDKIMAERVAEAAKKDETIDAQAIALDTVMARLEMLEANTLPLSSMTPPQLKGLAKRRGLDITGLKKKDELIALLEG